jgi:hypothetical protein
MAFPTITVTPGTGQTINTLPNAGQATSANSLPVVIASDQSAVPVSASALPLPTGAAVETGGNLATIATNTGRIPAQGQALAGASLPVVLPAAQITSLTPPTAVGLNAGTNVVGKFTTDQTTHGTTDLVAADITKVGGSALAIGQQLSTASLPVVLPAAQITSLTAPVLGAGSAIVGKVGIDQTTPGTSNGVQVTNTSLAVTQGTASSLNATVVGSGTAGTPAGGVLSVQGVGSGTPIPASLASLPALVAGSAIVGKVGIDQTTPGTTNLVAARTNSYRNGGTLHRSAITSSDKLSNPATPSGTGVTVSGGSLVSATSYAFAVVANNAYGNTLASATVSVTPGGSFNAVALTITPVTNATSYDLFCSSGTTTSMLWVGRITSTQLTAGNNQITVSGTIAAGTSATNVVNIACVGTQQAVNSQSFLVNTAYQWTGLTPIVCTGYSRANIYVQVSLTDLRSAPSLVLAPMFQNQTDSNYYDGSLITVNISGANGASLRQNFSMDVDGAANLVFLVDTIAGQVNSVNIWVELM